MIDLFAGAGGLSLGAIRAGFNLVAAIELDSNAIETHMMNFHDVLHIQEDITKLNGAKILELVNLSQDQVAGIIGGPPCQGFSNIGQRRIDDNRNLLFIKFFEIVRDVQPLFFVAENVPGIMSEKFQQVRDEAFALLKGYQILSPITVNASEYGAPTSRTRIFFIGYKNDSRIKAITVSDIEAMKVDVTSRTNVKQALEGLPEDIVHSVEADGVRKLDTNYIDPLAEHLQTKFFYARVLGLRQKNLGDTVYVSNFEKSHLVNGCLPTKHSEIVEKRYSELSHGQRDGISKSPRLQPMGFCPTLRAGTGPEKGSYQAVRPIHYKYPRVITPREAARLQGFPDWFKLPDTIWHSFRQIGNSVSPIVAERILSAIFQKLTL